MSAEHEFEPVPGLPETLPEGESILWQGKPGWRGVAVRALYARAVAVYFGILCLWRAADGAAAGEPLAEVAVAVGWLAFLGTAAVGVLVLIAWTLATTTIYTITTKRLVLRFGFALPITVNLPFSMVDGAELRLFRDGSGDLPLQISQRERMSWFLMWPHVRHWHLSRPQPTLRAVPEAARVADLLSGALLTAKNGAGVRNVAGETTAAKPDRDPGRLAEAT